MKRLLSILFILIDLTHIYGQPPGTFPRVLSRPDNSKIDNDVKVVDYQTGNCELESNCNYLYPVVNEEFDYPANMPNIWKFDLGYTQDDNVAVKTDGTGYSTWMGDAMAFNTTNTNPLNSDNFKFNSGILTLSHIYKPVYRNSKQYNFTSGMIKSLSNFRTGVFEAKIKVPNANKMFPAFWLLSNKGPYTEIDIFEYFDDDVAGSACSVYKSHRISTHNGEGGDRINRADLYPQNINTWHTYKLVWNDYEAKVYVDDDVVAKGYTTKFFRLYSLPLSHCEYGDNAHPFDPAISIPCDVLNAMPDNLLPHINFGSKPWWVPNWLPWPPPQPYLANRVSKEKIFPDKNSAMSVIINNWANAKYFTEDFSGFQQSSLNMEVDWVKVYQPFCCGVDKTVSNLTDLDDQTYYTDILTGRKLTIGSTSNNNNFSQNKPNQNNWRDIPVILLATDEIAIYGEAVFPGDTYAELRITDCGNAMKTNSGLSETQQIVIDSTLKILSTTGDSLAKEYYSNYMDSLKKEFAHVDINDIEIYPIPANDAVNIICNDWQFEQIKSLFLIDVNGKEIELKKERKLNIEKLAQGTYMLKLQMENNEILIKKLIKL